MPYLNEHTVIGHVGQEPEVRYLGNGRAVCNLSVATSESWKDKNTGEKKEKTSWHRVVVWGKGAEFAEEYVHSGDLVMVKAPSYTREWEDKSGEKKYTTELTCTRYEQFTLLKSKGEMLKGVANITGKPRSTSSDAPSQDLGDDIPF